MLEDESTFVRSLPPKILTWLAAWRSRGHDYNDTTTAELPPDGHRDLQSTNVFYWRDFNERAALMAVTPRTLARWKQNGRPIVALTATDYAFARILDRAEIDLLLVGDSLAMVALGHRTTLPLTLDAIVHHTQAVCRGVQRALVVVDLPFLSYQIDSAQAIAAAGRILKETGAAAVKLEGGYPRLVNTVTRLVETGIPVMGHIGLTPQSIHQTGYQQQGQTPAAEAKLRAEAIALQDAGAFCLVLEHIDAELARSISAQLTIPTIGIGAGSACDGQILVTHDLLGLSEHQPPFATVYADLQGAIETAARQYAADVLGQATLGKTDREPS